MTASSNEKVLGATVLLLTSAMTGNLARHAAALESPTADASKEQITKAAEQLIDEFLLDFVADPAMRTAGLSGPKPENTEGTGS